MKPFDNNLYISEQKLFPSLSFSIAGETVEPHTGVISAPRPVLYSTSLSKLEHSVRSKAKSLWAHDNLLWFLSFSNIIKYECRYSCTDSRDLAFNEIVRDMVYSNCFERDINLTGAICSIFFVCGRTKCIVLVVTRIKNFLRYMYICFL